MYKNIIKNNLSPAIYKISKRIINKGKGSWLYDINGNKILDFTSGIGVTSIGHNHPKLINDVKLQLDNLIHGQMNCMYNEPMLRLTSKMNTIVPENLQSYFYTNSGSESIENAIKIARMYTKKSNIISFKGAFHGRTIGAASISFSKSIQRSGFNPIMSGVVYTSYPDINDKNNRATNDFKDIFKNITTVDDTAAVIIECIQGEGGYIVPNPEFMNYLNQFCIDNNILLIVDEVQSGIYRTGKVFSYEHFNVNPDMICFAKGIGSGFPIGGVACRMDLMTNMQPNSLGGTYGGGPIVITAALYTLNILEEENILDNVNEKSQYLFNKLFLLKKKHKIIKDVRGYGLMVGLEFNKEYLNGIASKVINICEKKCLLLLTAGNNEVIRILPPLTVSFDEIDYALNILDNSISEIY